MNTKKVFKEKFIKDLIADYDNEKISLGKLVEILNEKIASPERGKEGKTADANEVIKKIMVLGVEVDKSNDPLQINMAINDAQIILREYAQSTSKPVELNKFLNWIMDNCEFSSDKSLVIYDSEEYSFEGICIFYLKNF